MPDPIIVKGGSVEIDFDPDVYKQDKGDKKKHANATKKIKSVQIKDENTGQVQTYQVPANGKCTITIDC